MLNVTCAIIVKNNKILATRRSETMRHPLRWEFPGGKIESGETPEECLHREIMEELRIPLRIIKPLPPQQHCYENFSINLMPFLCEYVSGQVVLTEHKEYRWCSREELLLLDWAEADRLILEVLMKELSA
ncbi:MAG TPA: (deoxy)nucleoside triphosphate pyrophosphohydrolase [Bacteroidales bacterium]|nr:(deoxy)nucleoside triphosphate pyrophosphohydrolase [Bacteroidales bacterium]